MTQPPWAYCDKCGEESIILHKVDGRDRYLCSSCVVANERRTVNERSTR